MPHSHSTHGHSHRHHTKHQHQQLALQTSSFFPSSHIHHSMVCRHILHNIHHIYGQDHSYGGYYGGYAYRPYYGGYGYWGRKKRSADAEPTADAWYGAYGYGRGYYGYGAYRPYYGYRSYGYWG